QFAAGEDLADYPRSVENDLKLLAAAEVDLVFMPATDEIYPADCTTTVKPPTVARKLEALSRPTHFEGVATIVLKLLNMTQCDVAFFGQKDYQQFLVVRHMVRDLNLSTEIVVCPVVRDAEGLALSSRNVYLSAAEHNIALSLNRTLRETARMIEQGETDGRAIMAHMTQALIEGGVTETDYAVIAHADTLELLEEVASPAVLLVAARVGETRLIDNLLIE
ncbi:MAG: pantoate--beta-alanine ligase, partial [Pirellulaceae bacterium]